MDIVKFVNEKFGIVRALTIQEDPWFVATDVAVALGYKKPYNALSKHVHVDDKLLLVNKNGNILTTPIQGNESDRKV